MRPIERQILEIYEYIYSKPEKLWYNVAEMYKLAVEVGYLVKLSTRGSLVLDVGCGNGRITTALRKMERIVIGIDFSRQAISRAKEKALEPYFLVCDARKLPFRAEVFDLVYFLGTLEYASNIAEFLVDSIRVTKPGGLIFFNVWSRSGLRLRVMFDYLIEKTIKYVKKQPFLVKRNCFSMRELVHQVPQNCLLKEISGHFFILPRDVVIVGFVFRKMFEQREAGTKRSQLTSYLSSFNNRICNSLFGRYIAPVVKVVLEKCKEGSA